MNNCDNVVYCDIIQLNDLEISNQIKYISKVFLKELFNSFNIYNQIEYFIDLLFDKLFKTGSIYNISYNEFATIKDILFIKKINNLLRFCVDYKKFNEIIIKNSYSLSLFSIMKRMTVLQFYDVYVFFF